MSTPQIHIPTNFHLESNAIITNSIASSPLAGFSAMHTQYRHLNADSSKTNWQGGSGKIYALEEVSVDDFVLDETHLYMLIAKNSAIWIGTAQDLIKDSASRIQFRQNSKFATKAYEIPLPQDEAHKIQMVADLLSGHPNSRLHAA